MKKCLLFFMLGVAVTLLTGAGTVLLGNAYAIKIGDLSGVMLGNAYAVKVDDSSGVMLGNAYAIKLGDLSGVMLGNAYAIKINDDSGVLLGNVYSINIQGEISENARNALAVGFVHGMAVGKKKASEERRHY